MTSARTIIADALTFGLNRLSPGETLDADTAAVCLRALASVVDELGGGKGLLWREVLTLSNTITGAGTLGTDWPTLAPGDLVLGASVSDSQDTMLDALTMAQYQCIADKAAQGTPRQYAHDGAATIYFYPAASGQRVTLRTKQALTAFPDLDTPVTMPAGYQSAFSAFLAEKMAPTLAPEMAGKAAADALRARRRLASQAMTPAIINAVAPRQGNILGGWL